MVYCLSATTNPLLTGYCDTVAPVSTIYQPSNVVPYQLGPGPWNTGANIPQTHYYYYYYCDYNHYRNDGYEVAPTTSTSPYASLPPGPMTSSPRLPNYEVMIPPPSSFANQPLLPTPNVPQPQQFLTKATIDCASIEMYPYISNW